MDNYEFDFTNYIIRIIENINMEIDIINNYDNYFMPSSLKYKNSKINELECSKKMYLKLLNKKYKMIYDNSKFNLNEIGNFLATLITNIENKKYNYMIIIDKDNYYNWVIKNNNKMIVLYKDKIEVFNKEIYFYDNNYNKIIDTKGLDYIYDFINQIINYRISNECEISKVELISLIHKLTYEKESNSYCKKLK